MVTPMRLTWATDIHLDFVPDEEHGDFYARLLAEDPTAILLSGDIANGRKVCAVLAELARFVARPVYFVLGNHDYYGRSVREFRATVTEFAAANPFLHYLTAGGIVELNAETALLGHDGWADARFGNFEDSTVFLNDFVQIEEFAYCHGAIRRRIMERLAQDAADHLERLLPVAAARYPRVFILTHVAPFAEASRFDGQPSDANWLPFFASRVVGDVLRGVLADFPGCEATVLCGHTHGAADVRILPNLRVVAGEAEYRRPAIQQTFTVGP